MSLQWKWCDCTPSYSEKCPGCKDRAMARPDGLVHLSGTAFHRHEHWHVDCLLNFFTESKAPLVKLELTDEELKKAMDQLVVTPWPPTGWSMP